MSPPRPDSPPASRPANSAPTRRLGWPLPAEQASDVAAALALVHESSRDEMGATALLAAASRGRARRELAAMAGALARNASLAEALGRVPSVFRADDVAAVTAATGSAAAEASVLHAIAARLAERAAVRRQIGQSAIYPAFLVGTYALLSPALLLITDSVSAFVLAAAQRFGWLVAVLLGTALGMLAATAFLPVRGWIHAAAWRLPWLAAPFVHHRRAVWAAALGRTLGAGMTPATALRCATLVTGDLALGKRVGDGVDAAASATTSPSPAVVDAADRSAFSRSLVRAGAIHPADALLATAAEVAGTLGPSLELLARRNGARRERTLRTSATLLNGVLTVALLANAAMSVVHAYQSFSLVGSEALPELGGVELPLSDLPLP